MIKEMISMNFDKIPNIDAGTFSMEIKFKSYGNMVLTDIEEKAILDDMPVSLQYKNINFSGKFNVVNGDVVEVNDTYTSSLVLTLPTTVTANPVSSGIANVTIGTKNIQVNVANTTTGVATANEIQTAILNTITSDTNILALYSVSDILASGGNIVASKTSTSDLTSKSNAINAI
jgi:hypothetical protein